MDTTYSKRGYSKQQQGYSKHNTLQPNCLTKSLNQSTGQQGNFSELFDKNTNRGQGQGANRGQRQWSNRG
jgi:hypothetical protein